MRPGGAIHVRYNWLSVLLWRNPEKVGAVYRSLGREPLGCILNESCLASRFTTTSIKHRALILPANNQHSGWTAVIRCSSNGPMAWASSVQCYSCYNVNSLSNSNVLCICHTKPTVQQGIGPTANCCLAYMPRLPFVYISTSSLVVFALAIPGACVWQPERCLLKKPTSIFSFIYGTFCYQHILFDHSTANIIASSPAPGYRPTSELLLGGEWAGTAFHAVSTPEVTERGPSLWCVRVLLYQI